ncbi:hypothetical protein AB0E87_30355, partial [Streptomyces sp. NPDC029704]
AWQARIEALLESLEDTEQARVADELRTLLAQQASHHSVSAGRSGLAVGGNVDVRATHGSAAALTMGNVTLGNPSRPGPHQD